MLRATTLRLGGRARAVRSVTKRGRPSLAVPAVTTTNFRRETAAQKEFEKLISFARKQKQRQIQKAINAALKRQTRDAKELTAHERRYAANKSKAVDELKRIATDQERRQQNLLALVARDPEEDLSPSQKKKGKGGKTGGKYRNNATGSSVDLQRRKAESKAAEDLFFTITKLQKQRNAQITKAIKAVLKSKAADSAAEKDAETTAAKAAIQGERIKEKERRQEKREEEKRAREEEKRAREEEKRAREEEKKQAREEEKRAREEEKKQAREEEKLAQEEEKRAREEEKKRAREEEKKLAQEGREREQEAVTEQEQLSTLGEEVSNDEAVVAEAPVTRTSPKKKSPRAAKTVKTATPKVEVADISEEQIENELASAAAQENQIETYDDYDDEDILPMSPARQAAIPKRRSPPSDSSESTDRARAVYFDAVRKRIDSVVRSQPAVDYEGHIQPAAVADRKTYSNWPTPENTTGLFRL